MKKTIFLIIFSMFLGFSSFSINFFPRSLLLKIKKYQNKNAIFKMVDPDHKAFVKDILNRDYGYNGEHSILAKHGWEPISCEKYQHNISAGGTAWHHNMVTKYRNNKNKKITEVRDNCIVGNNCFFQGKLNPEDSRIWQHTANMDTNKWVVHSNSTELVYK